MLVSLNWGGSRILGFERQVSRGEGGPRASKHEKEGFNQPPHPIPTPPCTGSITDSRNCDEMGGKLTNIYSHDDSYIFNFHFSLSSDSKVFSVAL